MTRKEARETVFCLVFEHSFQQEEPQERLENLWQEKKCNPKSREYIEMTYSGICREMEQIDEMISRHSGSWKLERLSKVTLALLRLGVYEIVFNPEVPNAVAINEAVELAKVYGEDEAPSFLNGILASVHKGTV